MKWENHKITTKSRELTLSLKYKAQNVTKTGKMIAQSL